MYSGGNPIQTMHLDDGTQIIYDSSKGNSPVVEKQKDGSYSIFNPGSNISINGSANGSNINIIEGEGVTFNGSGKGNDNINVIRSKDTKINTNDGNDNVYIFGGKGNHVNTEKSNANIKNCSFHSDIQLGEGFSTVYSRGNHNIINDLTGKNHINDSGPRVNEGCPGFETSHLPGHIRESF